MGDLLFPVARAPSGGRSKTRAPQFNNAEKLEGAKSEEDSLNYLGIEPSSTKNR